MGVGVLTRQEDRISGFGVGGIYELPLPQTLKSLVLMLLNLVFHRLITAPNPN